MKDTGHESSESTYWYIWTETKQLGPIFFNRLQQMAHQGKLTLDDKVRRGTTGEWSRVGDLTEVFFPDPVELEAKAATVAPPKSKIVPQPSRPGLVSNLVDSIRDRVDLILESLKDYYSDGSSGLRVVASWVALVTVLISLTVVLASQMSFAWLTAAEPFAAYTSAWDELKAKRDAKTEAAEWDAFAVKIRHQITPIVARLEKTASAENRLAQQLLYAGRDYLPQMLDDAREERSESETKFADHLQRARWLKEGKDLNGIYRGPRLLTVGQIPDNTTLIFGVVFVVFDIWVVVWLLRRWFNRRVTA